jgi:hypothetical protein
LEDIAIKNQNFRFKVKQTLDRVIAVETQGQPNQKPFNDSMVNHRMQLIDYVGATVLLGIVVIAISMLAARLK